MIADLLGDHGLDLTQPQVSGTRLDLIIRHKKHGQERPGHDGGNEPGGESFNQGEAPLRVHFASAMVFRRTRLSVRPAKVHWIWAWMVLNGTVTSGPPSTSISCVVPAVTVVDKVAGTSRSELV